MTDPVPVLLHSPLVGPQTWRSVATFLARPAVVPDLRSAPEVGVAFAEAAAAAVPEGGGILVGHSGAGPWMPHIARLAGGRVRKLIYVDSVLPYPGRSWVDNAPEALVSHLRRLIGEDGRLPPWDRWFAPEMLDGMVPDPAGFRAELPRLRFSSLNEPMPPDVWSGPAAYLLLSDGYRADASAAAEAGMPVAELIDHHLAMLTRPGEVAAILARLF